MLETAIWVTGTPFSGVELVASALAEKCQSSAVAIDPYLRSNADIADVTANGFEWESVIRSAIGSPQGRQGFGTDDPAGTGRPAIVHSLRHHEAYSDILAKVGSLKILAVVANPVASIATWLDEIGPAAGSDGASPDWRGGAAEGTGNGAFGGFEDWKRITSLQIDGARRHPDRFRVIPLDAFQENRDAVVEDVLNWLGIEPGQARAHLTSDADAPAFDGPAYAANALDAVDPAVRFEIGRELVGTPLARFCDTRTLAVGAGWTGPPADRNVGKAKAGIDDLAFFGGPALFQRGAPRPIGQLVQPSAEAFSDAVDTIYETQRISNNGHLVQSLEERLKAYHSVRNCVVMASASLAIIGLLQLASRTDRRNIVLPAFTYVGLPHLARWAGFEPLFCDVDRTTHTISPTDLERLIGDDVAAVLAVHQVNAPCHHAELTEIGDRHGVPIIYDSVHALGCTLPDGTPIGALGVAEVFSLHATKMLNGFEGGYITTNDDDLAERLRKVRNFGYRNEISTEMIGLNAKLNEIHAGFALASLDEIDDVIRRNKERYDRYKAAFDGIPGVTILPYGEGYRDKNFEFALIDVSESWPLGRDETVQLLRAENALARQYYNEPLYLHSDYPSAGNRQKPNLPQSVVMPLMPVTDALSRRIIQMPVGESVSLEDIDAMGEWFRFISSTASDIIPRLRETGAPVW
ncbi:dTDP-4-amino-4,6-dideoxygalactose transaminase [Rhodobium orientis]|uniref:DegT/DnrJ/EryC1/StrS aminotransferase n=1 Tax=Rhodobium orientis TaxID=34017 RepID=A0A327JR54_9HYPH|nr:aminotransferase class I/II-fold pyridoxal phosphate-dependent enzyme [Rhodobium orientis]MBB4304257.1 dTDP-4-amino-4,6-dideoxygalactose transaminase [Rhodobium orientis]MBK5948247.1 hypothetical protein [Rhodobium orientis]RAI28767.1 hypothetical protein CH339_05010 [Rhodobium orientis]